MRTQRYYEVMAAIRADQDQKVAALCAAEPTMKIRDLATRLGITKFAVCDSMRRRGISRLHLTGRPRKQGN